MGNVVSQILSEAPKRAGERVANIVGSATCQVPVTCGCGSRNPIFLVVVPGMELVAQCPSCRTQFRIKKITYEAGVTPRPMVEIDVALPNIITPSVS